MVRGREEMGLLFRCALSGVWSGCIASSIRYAVCPRRSGIKLTVNPVCLGDNNLEWSDQRTYNRRRENTRSTTENHDTVGGDSTSL